MCGLAEREREREKTLRASLQKLSLRRTVEGEEGKAWREGTQTERETKQPPVCCCQPLIEL